MLIPCAALLLCGCVFFSPEATVSVVIPEPPPHWRSAFPDLRFVLLFFDSDGACQRREVSDWRAPVQVSCGKGTNTPIMAYPRIPVDAAYAMEGAGLLRPAGGLYPSSLAPGSSGEALRLSWEDGPVALLAFRLLMLGRDVARLNAGRLRHYIAEESDPWNLDLDSIAEKLAVGDFTRYDLDLLPRRDVVISPGNGTWFLESPFSPAAAAATGDLELSDVSLGTHDLFSVEGGFYRLRVDKNEVILVIPEEGSHSWLPENRR